MKFIRNIIVLGLICLLEKVTDASKCGYNSNLLPKTYFPRYYDIQISIDPSKNSYIGRVSILIDSATWANATNWIILHTDRLDELNPGDVRLDVLGHSINIESICMDPDLEILVIGYDINSMLFIPYSRRKLRLSIDFKKKMRNDYRGLHRTDSIGNEYIYTGFGRQQMRRVFPCFDEPRFHAIVTLTLVVPFNETAIFITDIASTQVFETGKMITFLQTESITTQQMAFAIFRDTQPKTATTSGNVKVNLYTPNHPQANISVDEIAELFHAINRNTGPWHRGHTLSIVLLNDIGSRVATGIGVIICDINSYWVNDSPNEVKHMKKFEMGKIFANQWFGQWLLRASALDLWLFEALSTLTTHSAMSGGSSFSIKLYYYSTSLQEAFENQASSECWPMIPHVMFDREYFEIDQPSPSMEADKHRDYFIDNSTRVRSLFLIRTIREYFDFSMYYCVRDFMKNNRSKIYRTTHFLRSLDVNSRQNVIKFVIDYLTRVGAPLIKVDRFEDENGTTFRVTQERLQLDYFNSTSNIDNGFRYYMPIAFSFGKLTSKHVYLGRHYLKGDQPDNNPSKISFRDKNLWALFNRRYSGFYRVIYSNKILDSQLDKTTWLKDDAHVFEFLMIIEDARALFKANRVGPSYLAKILYITRLREFDDKSAEHSADLVHYSMISAFNELRFELRGTRHEMALMKLGVKIFENLFKYHHFSENVVTSMRGLKGRQMIYELLAEADHEQFREESLMALNDNNNDWTLDPFRRAIAISISRGPDEEAFNLILELYKKHRDLRRDLNYAMSRANTPLRLEKAFHAVRDKNQSKLFVHSAIETVIGRYYVMNRILFKVKDLMSELGTDGVLELVLRICRETYDLPDCSEGNALSRSSYFNWRDISNRIQSSRERKYRIFKADDDEIERALSISQRDAPEEEEEEDEDEDEDELEGKGKGKEKREEDEEDEDGDEKEEDIARPSMSKRQLTIN